MTLELIDTHCHLDLEDFDADRAECIQRAVAAGVTRMITIGTRGGLEGPRAAIALAEQYPMIWATVGIHPQRSADSVDPLELERLAQHPKVVAIGETGLDFFRDWAPKDKQYEAFIMQIELAKRVRKPLIIHSRDAGQEVLRVLEEHGAKEVGGVFHCFSEDVLFAQRLREIHFKVSFPGQLTFKKAEQVRKVCEQIPLEQILVETDSPFLAPEPHRGKRCEPAFVVETARRLANIRGMSLEELAQITTRNALSLFIGIQQTNL
jgi:TatD DNase family protein